MTNNIGFGYGITDSGNGEKASEQISWIQSNIRKVSKEYWLNLESSLRSDRHNSSERNPDGIYLNISMESDRDLTGVLEKLLSLISLKPMEDMKGSVNLCEIVQSYKPKEKGIPA